jgi:hypothetical protein
MKAFGSKRTFGNCATKLYKHGGKIHVTVRVKNRKAGRQVSKNDYAIYT